MSVSGIVEQHGAAGVLHSLLEIASELDNRTLAPLLIDTFYQDAAPGLNEAEYQVLFARFTTPEARTYLMTADERTALVELPETLTVFRGFNRDGGERGFSWSLDRGTAEGFALDRPYGPAYAAQVAIGRVAKARIIAYVNRYGESEVLTLPEAVSVQRIERLAP